MDKANTELIMAAGVVILVIYNIMKTDKNMFDYAMIVFGIVLIIRQLYVYYLAKKS